MQRRKYPCLLDADDFQAVIDAALRDYNVHDPLISFVSFTTKEQVGDYYVFDATDVNTHVADPLNPGQFLALCAGAITIRDVYWNPGGDWSSLNIFSPGWQMLSQVVLYTGSYFHQPSQMMTLRQKLDSWKTQFGAQGFEVFGATGEATAFLRIYPLPMQNDGHVIVEMSKGHTLDTVAPSEERFFYQWLEVHLCEAIANAYSQTAGVELLGFKDAQAALRYWERKFEQKYEKVLAIQAGPQGQGERS